MTQSLVSLRASNVKDSTFFLIDPIVIIIIKITHNK